VRACSIQSTHVSISVYMHTLCASACPFECMQIRIHTRHRVGVTLIFICIRIRVEREVETENRKRNSTKMQQFTYVMLGMLSKTPIANDLMFLLSSQRVPEVVEHDPDDDKTASSYIRYVNIHIRIHIYIHIHTHL